MKKLVSALLISSMLLCLCACTNQKETTNTLPGDDNTGKISAGSTVEQTSKYFETDLPGDDNTGKISNGSTVTTSDPTYFQPHVNDSEVEGPGGYIPPDDVYEDDQFKVEKYSGMYRIWEKNDPVYAYRVEQDRIGRNEEENGYVYVGFDLFDVFEKIFTGEETVYEGMTANEFLVKLTDTCMERYKEYKDANYESTKATFPDTNTLD